LDAGKLAALAPDVPALDASSLLLLLALQRHLEAPLVLTEPCKPGAVQSAAQSFAAAALALMVARQAWLPWLAAAPVAWLFAA
jgi:hypothetical protein